MTSVGEYRPAAICRRGHVMTRDATITSLATRRCQTCGAEVITRCPSCNGMIRGHYFVPGVIGFGGNYTPPDFCADCGAPFPWASRQARIYELMNLLDEEELDPAAELTVREHLEALTDADLDEDEQGRRWERVKRLAPGLWERSGARTIIEIVVSAGIRSGLGW